MIKYLTILLDDTSVSFCHADNPYSERNLIPIDTLKKGIVYAMKENLSIQFVYPDYALPREYIDVINTIDHININSATYTHSADLVVIDDIYKLRNYTKQANFDTVYIIRCKYEDLLNYEIEICEAIIVMKRINIIIKDVENFSDTDIEKYSKFLKLISDVVSNEYNKGHQPQINILTDRLFLDTPNHCNAGVESITLSPNGKFYICPEFYYDEFLHKDQSRSIGDVNTGIDIKNPQLYKLQFAPICRICDAYHCKRCIWLNKKLTREINTPSKQQCTMEHLERNSTRFIKNNLIVSENIKDIPEIDYLDPFEYLLNK